MARDKAYYEAEKKIQKALKSGATELDLNNFGEDKLKLTELPESLRRLTQLRSLNLLGNQLTVLPEWLGELTQLQSLELSDNQLTALSESLKQLINLEQLKLGGNKLSSLPGYICNLINLTNLQVETNHLKNLPKDINKLTKLKYLNIGWGWGRGNNKFFGIPEQICDIQSLEELEVGGCEIGKLTEKIGQLVNLKVLVLSGNNLADFPSHINQLEQLESLYLDENRLTEIPSSIILPNRLKTLSLSVNDITKLSSSLAQLEQLESLYLDENRLTEIPSSIILLNRLETLSLSKNSITKLSSSLAQLENLRTLNLNGNQLTDLPPSLAQLEHLEKLDLKDNPLNLALQSAYDAGLDELKAYLRSIENAEPLYEAKLVLVGEGNVGKTTLLKALKGNKEDAPQKNEPTTHGVEIDIHGLRLPHPAQDGVMIQLNAWDFGGQDVYRVTHQFFFSRRSLYLLVWEPRRGVQQGQVEDWLNMIRLRVGNDARVLIVSTHCKTGERIARIDKPVLQQQYGEMIIGFYEVDSLVPDEQTGEMVGIAELKKVIAEQAAQLEQMGMLFSPQWKAARDELIAHPEPRISYAAFVEICAQHELSPIAAKTLAHLMHDLGYIVHYSDDERLREDVVLQPQWLTKAIGFVLEDRATQDAEGILLDKRLTQVWRDHPFEKEPRYNPDIYPFFLRLMEKYDVCYRLTDGKASLVAQHVPQVRPELPWLPEGDPPANLRRIAMICAMEEDPPGLVPWMIVRTHDYAVEQKNPTGSIHRLHWQKGMFLSHAPHGEAMLEKRGNEFHVYAQGDWPEYFLNVLQNTLQKLIKDNWPGMEGRYRFTVPCPGQKDGKPCPGRFNLKALREFMAKGASLFPCQECFQMHSITELLLGFEERSVDQQLREIKEQLAGLDSRIANYFMAMMHAIADEAKHGPRLFTFRSRDAGLSPKQLFSRPITLQLWCEAEGCQHPVNEKDKGVYSIDQPREWVMQIAPYANFILDVLKTIAPMVAPGINILKGPKTTENWKDHLDLSKAIIDKLPAEIKIPEHSRMERGILSEHERSGILALHRLLNELDPTQDRLGLHRVATYTGDYRWLCQYHYDAWQPRIPDVIEPAH